MTIEYAFVSTVFGRAFLASSGEELCRLSFVPESDLQNELKVLTKKFPQATLNAASNIFMNEKFRSLLDFHSLSQSSKFSLAAQGTEFQNKVWDYLRKIPPGRTTTYGDIARAIGHPKAVRAVGSAVGSNPVGYLIPCHRVLPRSGQIGKFAWGTRLKQRFLEFDANSVVSSPALALSAK